MNVLTKKLRHKLFFIKHKIDFHTIFLVHFEIKQNSVSPLSRKKGFESKQRHENHFIQPRRRRFLWGRRSEAVPMFYSRKWAWLYWKSAEYESSTNRLSFRFEDIYLFFMTNTFSTNKWRFESCKIDANLVWRMNGMILGMCDWNSSSIWADFLDYFESKQIFSSTTQYCEVDSRNLSIPP